jgi:hypothetical protein
VTLVIDGRSHILSLTAQRLPEGYPAGNGADG